MNIPFATKRQDGKLKKIKYPELIEEVYNCSKNPREKVVFNCVDPLKLDDEEIETFIEK